MTVCLCQAGPQGGGCGGPVHRLPPLTVSRRPRECPARRSAADAAFRHTTTTGPFGSGRRAGGGRIRPAADCQLWTWRRERVGTWLQLQARPLKRPPDLHVSSTGQRIYLIHLVTPPARFNAVRCFSPKNVTQKVTRREQLGLGKRMRYLLMEIVACRQLHREADPSPPPAATHRGPRHNETPISCSAPAPKCAEATFNGTELPADQSAPGRPANGRAPGRPATWCGV